MKYYLNEIETDKLIKLNADEVLKGALKKVFLEEIYSMGILEKEIKVNEQNWAYALGGNMNNAIMTDAELGSLLKSTVSGISALERAFDRLEDFKTPESQDEKLEENPAE